MFQLMPSMRCAVNLLHHPLELVHVKRLEKSLGGEERAQCTEREV
jgi:hypothetical protein